MKLTVSTREQLEEMRGRYNKRVAATRPGKFVDMAISAPGALYILDRLTDHYGHDPMMQPARPFRVLDMGLGYSTLFVGAWMLDRFVVYDGFDHNEEWIAFMRALVEEVMPSFRRLRMDSRKDFVTQLDELAGSYDAILVDHGPELQTRADDVPMIVRLLRPDGIMLFDDWRPKHEGRIRRALAAVGGSWEIEAPEHVRRYPRDKTIGFVRRKQP